MNITLTGNLGAGKSSVCKELKAMGYEIIQSGTIFREIAEQKGISVIELNELAKKSRDVDDMIDNRSTELGEIKDNAVFDSRMAWHFVNNSFKVFLLIDSNEAAARVLNDTERKSESYETVEDATNGLKERALLEKDRFKQLYGVDYYDLKNYDFVIESTYATPKEIATEIIRNFELYKEVPFTETKIELNTKNIYPTQGVRDFNNTTFEERRSEEKNNPNLCALTKVPVTIQNGYNYLIDGHHRMFAAANQGKPFTEVRIIPYDQTIMPMEKSALYDFEDIGKFIYKAYPTDIINKASYLAEFPIEDDRKGLTVNYNDYIRKTYNPESIEKIDIKDTNEIEAYAFEGCKNLKAIDIPDNIENIGHKAFADCINLESVDMSEKLYRSISKEDMKDIFSGCNKLDLDSVSLLMDKEEDIETEDISDIDNL